MPIQGDVLRILKEMRIPRVDDEPAFLLEGDEAERLAVWPRFSKWMQSVGWNRRKKAHELRKLYGSEVSKQAGISVAQDLLGHAHISTTKGFYVAAQTASVNVAY